MSDQPATTPDREDPPRGDGTEYDPGPVPEPDFDAEERTEEDQ